MGTSYFTSAAEREAYTRKLQAEKNREAAHISDGRQKVAAKIVMAVVDKIITEIVRPGPAPEERECYEMAGELRTIVPELEKLAKRIIDVNDGIE